MRALINLIGLSSTAAWSCGIGASPGLTLDVIEVAPYSYSVSQIGGGPWLSGGSLSFFVNGVEYAANSSLNPGLPSIGTGVDDLLGAYSFFSVPWQTAGTQNPAISLLANFSCYASGGYAGDGIAVFELLFPSGLPNASVVPPPQQGNYEAGGNAFPSTRFPSFLAGPSDAVRNPELRYVEYAGCMSSLVSISSRRLLYLTLCLVFSGYRTGKQRWCRP